MAVICQHLIFGDRQEAEAKVIPAFPESPDPEGPTALERGAEGLLPAACGQMQVTAARSEQAEMLQREEKREGFPDNH